MSTEVEQLVHPLDLGVGRRHAEPLAVRQSLAEIASVTGWRHVRARRYVVRDFYPIAKRVLDVMVSSIALALLAPLLLLIAPAVAIDGTGPVLYRQERVGRHARRFVLYKFRTMRSDRRQRQAPIFCGERRRTLKSDGDPRVTAIGRLLRKTSLDELPQLINVIRGEMSLVGPRPELPAMLRYYRPEHYRRHVTVPGLTGWWQINGRCRRGSYVEPDEDLTQKLADDLFYIERRSLWFDIRVLLRTIPVVLSCRGAI